MASTSALHSWFFLTYIHPIWDINRSIRIFLAKIIFYLSRRIPNSDDYSLDNLLLRWTLRTFTSLRSTFMVASSVCLNDCSDLDRCNASFGHWLLSYAKREPYRFWNFKFFRGHIQQVAFKRHSRASAPFLCLLKGTARPPFKRPLEGQGWE